MSRAKNQRRIPSLTLHKPTGRARVRIDGKDHYLGEYGSYEAQRAYDRLISKWLAMQSEIPAEEDTLRKSITVDDLIIRYLAHCEQYYCKSYEHTREPDSIRIAVNCLRPKFETEPASGIGPKKLKIVRQKMIDDGLSRKYINQQIDRIRQMFRWAAEEELLPGSVYQNLMSVARLRKGFCKAVERASIKPVADADIEKALPYMPPVVRDMVRLQRLLGCRPTEVCRIRPGDIDRSTDIWIYTPETHKTEHHGKERPILIGPQGQAILLAYLDRGEGEYCFSPAESVRLQNIDKRRKRQSKVQPSQQNRKKENPQHQPGDRYDTCAYRKAIHRACDKAKIPRWSPNRIRHTAATELRAQFGAEIARVVLGHSNLSTTEIYAERDLDAASEAVRKIG